MVSAVFEEIDSGNESAIFHIYANGEYSCNLVIPIELLECVLNKDELEVGMEYDLKLIAL